MLKASWIPTPLVVANRRPPVPIREVEPPSPYRSLYVVGQFLLLALSLLGMLIRPGRHDADRMARRVREVFERMGGLWIKAGQLIALRIDLLPMALARELSRLQSQALGFPGDVARRIIEEDMGGPIDRFFDRWEPVPIAAASIGQVHRARLRDEQIWVAVKVQKPYSAELFARDLVVIDWLVRLINVLGILPHLKWQDALYELRQIMREELDFGYEAGSSRRMRRKLRPHRIYVPEVFPRYCTPRVLVSEFLEMVLMVDYLRAAREDPVRLEHWREQNGVDPRQVARRLVYSFQRQMLEDNLYHGDLHPGNIGLLRNGRVAVIDFGTTNFTEADYLRRFRGLMRTIASGEFAKSADMCLMLCASLPQVDLTVVHTRLVRVLQSWATRTWVKELPFHDKSMGNLTMEVMQVLLRYRCTMEWAWLRLHRASSTLDASLIELAPGIDYRKMTSRTFAMAGRRRLLGAWGATRRRQALRVVGELGNRPARTQTYVATQAALIRRQAQVFRGLADRAGQTAATAVAVGRLLVLAQAALVVGVAASAWWAAGAGEWIGQWLAGFVTDPSSPDVRPLVAVLLVDAWLWFALARVRRAIGSGRVYPHRRVVAA